MTHPTASSLVAAALLFALFGCATSGLDHSTRLGNAPTPLAAGGSPPVSTRPDPVSMAARRESWPSSGVPSDFEWPAENVFQSAGRLRALGLPDEGGIDPLAEQQRLRAHFGAVIDWLEARESVAIATAIVRLEEARGERFGEAERGGVEATLRRSRDHQLVVLERYSRRGEFPIHPDPGAPSQPIFVDATGTACAVGHLMRVDGWENEVETIRASDNDVYVSDLDSGPVLAWVVASGLLIEEAAVIQPSYMPPPAPGNVDLAALAAPGASASASGLQLQHFSATRTSLDYVLPPGLTPEILAVVYPHLSLREAIIALGIPPTENVEAFEPATLADIRLHVYQGYTDGNGGLIQGVFESPSGSPSPFLFWNAGDAGGFLSAMAGETNSVLTEIAFDVSPSDPGFGIDAAYFDVAGDFFWGGTGSYGTDLLVEMEVRSRSGQLLASFSSEGGSPFGFAPFSDTASFAPQEGVSVVVRGSLPMNAETDGFWGQFRQDFRIVPIPEPGAAILLGLGIVGLSLIQDRGPRATSRAQNGERSPDRQTGGGSE